MRLLEIKWSVSKARDTYGYNICTIRDGNTKYKTCGGGYDMIGKAFGEWLQVNYMDKIIATLKPYVYGNGENLQGEHYGFFYHFDTKKYWLDGACGLSSMQKIAKDIGLYIETHCNRKGHVTHYVVGEN